MINLQKNKVYTNNVTDLAFKVIKINYASESYIKVKGYLLYKNDMSIIEGPKIYKLYFKLISDWYEINQEVYNA